MRALFQSRFAASVIALLLCAVQCWALSTQASFESFDPSVDTHSAQIGAVSSLIHIGPPASRNSKDFVLKLTGILANGAPTLAADPTSTRVTFRAERVVCREVSRATSGRSPPAFSL